MANIDDRDEVRATLAKIIADTCRCEQEPLLKGEPFTAVIEQFDSLAMLEILLCIETAYGIDSEEMAPRDYTTSEEFSAHFPNNLEGLIDHMHAVVARRSQSPVVTEGTTRIEPAVEMATTEESDSKATNA